MPRKVSEMRNKGSSLRAIDQFTDLLFPRSCCGCENILLATEKLICTHCMISLPKTQWHEYPENPVVQIFKGRCDITFATAFLNFRKGSMVQKFLHNLKYRSQQELGVLIGEIMGTDLALAKSFKDVNAIIPIPLHRRKLSIRGYNQSELLSRGIANTTQWKLDTESLQRKKFTESQTTKDRLARQLNLSQAFVCGPFQHNHVLLVDDVITTGATIESAIESIKTVNPDCRVSVASLAVAE